jgi:RHS repeat-associated protein
VFAEGSSFGGGNVVSSPLFASPLVVAGVQGLDGAQQVLDRAQALRDDPGAVVARELSRTAFRNLGSARAALLAREMFPVVVDEPAGGPPSLPAGQRIVRYMGARTAQLSLAGGKHAVIESLGPIATPAGPDRYRPVNLALADRGGSFVPANSDVAVQIPKRLSSGVALPGIGVSLMPTNSSGAPLAGGQGALDGASVIYANTQTDADTLVKPTIEGFEINSLLRSSDSPSELYFRVGVPRGARLIQDRRSGAVSIVEEGQALAGILPPSARDAAGTAVPVSMSVSGDMLTLMVHLGSGSYQFPVAVDPTVTDNTLFAVRGTDWRFVKEGSKFWGGEKANSEGAAYEWLLWNEALPGLSEWGELAYPVQPGEARIYQFTSTTAASGSGSGIANKLAILKASSKWEPEAEEVMPESYGTTEKTLCASAGCPVTGGTPENAAVMRLEPTREYSGADQLTLTKASVSLYQTNGPSIGFNTVHGEGNVLHANTWLGPKVGFFEANASDPGVGVTEIRYSSPSSSEWKTSWPNSECVGEKVQCSRTLNLGESYGSLGPHHLPDGEDTVEAKAFNSTGSSASTSATVKVDGTAPHNIKLLNLPANHEIGSQQYHLKAEATDGTAPVPSSGVASIALAVDGKEVGKPSGSCPLGPCTATSGEWTISGAEYGVGPHTITLTATDNVGNVAKEEIPLFVSRPTTPVAMGPGSLNPQSGELSLGTTDVSVGGPGGGLTVSRSYGSLHVTPGTESEQSPLGSGWSLSLAGEQNVTKLPNGNVLLTAGTGLQAVFVSKGGGEFTPPKGDEGLKIKEVENKEKVKEFTLTDGGGSVTQFTLASGGTGSTWVPTTREGANKTSVTTFAYQTVNGVTEPTEELAPVAAGIKSCVPLERGCRALGFVYDAKTTAKGESSSEWGEYEGRLKEIVVSAWEPSVSKMQTTTVAEYAYDKQGRLRAEWDPRISPALKSIYGYDAAGHITALTSAGQQPWLFTYGTIAGDTRTGRLLATSRPSASAVAGSGVAPVNTTVPALSSSSPTEGVSLSVTTGTWSNSPLSYSYQWEECSGEVCAAILGATNRSYTPIYHAEAYSLRVQVTATDSDGSVAVSSNKSGTVLSPGFFEKKTLFSNAKSGKFSKPSAVVVESAEASAGNVWVSDTGNNRILKFSSSGEFLAAYGKEGTGNEDFKGPEGIALDRYGNVFVADTGNDRIEVFNSSGQYVTQVATTGPPKGIVVAEAKTRLEGREERLYVVEPSKNAVQMFALSDSAKSVRLTDLESFGTEGTGFEQFKAPTAITTVSKSESGEEQTRFGNYLYVADNGNKRFEVFAPWIEGEVIYSSQFGEHGTTGELSSPGALALESNHISGATGEPLRDDLFADTGSGSIQQYSQGGVYLGEHAMGAGVAAIAFNTGKGTNTGAAYVADTTENTIAEWVPAPLPTPPPPSPPTPGATAVTTIEYHVPISGSGAPYAMGSKEVEGWAQKDDPSEATAIFPPDEPEGWPAQNYKRASLYYLDSTGHTVNAVSPSGAISTTEYNSTDDVSRTLSPDNRAAALKEGSKSAEASKLLDSESTYNSEGNELLETLGPLHTVKLASGTQVEARAHTVYSYGEGAPAEGGPYRLVTKVTSGAQTTSKEEFDVRTTTTSYSGQENLGWKLRQPTSVTTDPSGLKLTHTTLYEASTGSVIETRTPASPGASSPHDTQTIYYTTAANSKYPGCGEHAEWANLPCQTQPAKQPETSGLPNLPVTTVTYNIWDEPATTTQTVGSTTRTTTDTYDTAGRMKSTAISSTVGTALPTVTDEYNKETGAPEKQSTTTEGKTKTITSIVNSLGELTSYTDADENTATYNYDIDGRLEQVNDGKGTQTYTYSATTGFPAQLVDSAAGTFTASYDTEGNMLTEGYPNGMNANYTYNQVGKPVGLEYLKTTHCTEKCSWFSDTVVPSIHGQWLEQNSTLSHQAYTYDAAGRLTQVQNTPAGKGCTTRIYAYEEDTNRTGLTTREPGTEGKCATEGGTIEKHTYDTADRLTDTGTAYNTFGDITSLSASDAGGTELASTYYVDNQLASQTQNGQTIGYNLDPAGRTRETIGTGKKVSDVTSHYAGPGNSPAWTVNTSGEWTRNIPGINGSLAAVQNNGETPVLQLTNLHGDIIATAYLSETATGLASTADTSEFGVPTTSLPPKYSWLGTDEIPTELPSGVLDMGARSYVPQLGRFLQPDPRPGGSANAYTYTFGDPVNTFDPSGEYTIPTPSWLIQASNERSQITQEEIAARRAAEEAAARAAAEATIRAIALDNSGASIGEEEWGEEEYSEEYEEEEYASYHPHAENGKEAAHSEDGVLYQPLGESATFYFRIWNEGHEAGSRCVQYGGHWKGHRCVGVRSPGKDNKATCSMIATSVEAPFMWIPASYVPYAVSMGSCQIF